MKLLLYSTLCFLIIGRNQASPPRSQQLPLGTDVTRISFLNADFDAFVHDTLEAWHVPGLSIAIVDGDAIHAKVLICPSPSDAPLLIV